MKTEMKSLEEKYLVNETKMIFVRLRDRVEIAENSKDSLLFTLIIFRTPESYRLDKILKNRFINIPTNKKTFY